MGLGFLHFVLKCIQPLAWPSFALGYPLFASIQAIETNSKLRIRNLVTYWILFSLLLLFEHTFSKLLEWVPMWSYVKISAIFWLVIPGFNGASIAYSRLVRPCLSAYPLESVLELINEEHGLYQKDESFLFVAERYIDENGTEALQKLIANKTTTNMNADMEVRNMMPPASLMENTTTSTDADLEVKNITPASPTENVQREWTCTVCQFKINSETTLNSHLRGKKHKAKVAELETVMIKVQANVKNGYHSCSICNTTCKYKTSMASHLRGKKHLSQVEKSVQSSLVHYWCNICDATFKSNVEMSSHLYGTKHASQLDDSH